VSLGHPCKFQRVSCLGSITARHSSSGHEPNFAALSTGRHLYSAGRLSRWALAHILVVVVVVLVMSIIALTTKDGDGACNNLNALVAVSKGMWAL